MTQLTENYVVIVFRWSFWEKSTNSMLLGLNITGFKQSKTFIDINLVFETIYFNIFGHFIDQM